MGVAILPKLMKWLLALLNLLVKNIEDLLGGFEVANDIPALFTMQRLPTNC